MLTFNLKKEWFEKIKIGEKTHEYRRVNDYWTKRIDNAFLKGERFCWFALGYPSKFDDSKWLKAYIRNVKMLENGINTDLKTNNPVYDIEFELLS